MKQKQKTGHRRIFYIETYPCPTQEKPEDLPQKSFWYNHDKLERQHLPLGETLELLVYNIWQGFHPDTFTALCGCILGGGSIVLLGPPLKQLAFYQDPSLNKISNWPHICPAETYYLKKLAISLQHLLIHQSDASDKSPVIQYHLQAKSELELHRQIQQITATHKCTSPLGALEELPPPTAEQCAFIAQATDFKETSNNWISLFANRGFGKTTALKLLMLECTRHHHSQPPLRIYYVTQRKQPRLDMFQWWRNHPALEPFVTKKSNHSKSNQIKPAPRLSLQTTSLESLQKLKINDQGFQLVLIDESASFNISTLETVLTHLNMPRIKVILASSIDGYEGSAMHLQHYNAPRTMLPMPLTVPMRWSNLDPVDHWIKTFFYARTTEAKASPPPPTPPATLQLETQLFNPEPFQPEPFQPEPFQPEKASNSELSQWMNLMSTAHYRTRPSDLRIMLDAPGQVFYCIRHETRIIAGLWVSLEGPLPQRLHQDIIQGRRRLKGHLAPQYAAKYAAEQDNALENAFDPIQALQRQWVRIIRIAIAPELQRKGAGTCLIECCKRQYDHATMAVSFTPKEHLHDFWLALGFQQLTPRFYMIIKDR